MNILAPGALPHDSRVFSHSSKVIDVFYLRSLVSSLWVVKVLINSTDFIRTYLTGDATTINILVASHQYENLLLPVASPSNKTTREVLSNNQSSPP